MSLSKYRIFLSLISLWLIAAAVFDSCDLPRDNPLDPDAYNYGLADPEQPELPLLQLSSYHSSQWFPAEDIFTMEVTVSGALSETADSVRFVYNDTLGYAVNKSGNLWRLSLETSSLPAASIFDLIGVYFHSAVYFTAGDSTNTNDACLYRIIETIPFTDHPANGETVSSYPIFTWLPDEIFFSYNYILTINHISLSGFVTQVASIEDIPSDTTAWSYPTPLSVGNYYWTISIEDVYHNISRSKEAAFTVAP